MRHWIDCPTCACLLDSRENACPFCGAVVRRTEGWSMLGFGFMIGLATAACGDKSGTTTATEGASSSGESSSDSSGSGETTGTSGGTSQGETTIDDMPLPTTFGEVSAYAGPDTSDTLPDTSSSTDGNTDTGTGTGTGSTGTGTDTGSTTDFPETSAYAGPDTTGG